MDGINKHVPVDTKEADGTMEDLEEARYFHEVCVALHTYEKYANMDIDKIERNFNQLSAEDKALLQIDIKTRVEEMRDAIKLNQSFLNILLTQSEDIKGNKSFECSERNESGLCSCPTSNVNISKVRSTLKQFAREWSSYRQEERESAYRPLLDGLKRLVPLSVDGKSAWVLCPGSGLGRLPYEIHKMGYSSQGNEFSYFMLIGSYFMLNNAMKVNSMAIQPYVLNTMNRYWHSDNTNCVMLPDISPLDDLEHSPPQPPPQASSCQVHTTTSGIDNSCSSGGGGGGGGSGGGSDFSMCAGEFCTIYSGMDQRENWDSVVTCFFLDTARNVIQYIRIIAHVLKPKGVWLNLGPLLYHYAGEDEGMSIELSYEELKSIISNWFEIIEEKRYDCLYTSHPNSLMQVIYHSVYFAAVRKEEITNQPPIEPPPGRKGEGGVAQSMITASGLKIDRSSLPCGPTED